MKNIEKNHKINLLEVLEIIKHKNDVNLFNDQTVSQSPL